MKYIPNERFEAINSLLSHVKHQPGVTLTLRLEAFTCRHTKEDKQIASDLAHYIAKIQSTPPVSPLSTALRDPSAPPLLVLGGTSSAESAQAPTVVDPDDVDERLVYCVGALNSLYQDEGYDFTVLSESDFMSHSEEAVVGEVDFRLQQLPQTCSSAVCDFWASVRDLVGTAAEGCEFFEFRCPSCDPLADGTVDAHTYLLYNRRKKVLVSLLMYSQ